MLLGSRPAAEAVLHTEFEKLDLLPSNMDLRQAELELVDVEHREARLKSALSQLREQYGFIFIDCPALVGTDHNKRPLVRPIPCMSPFSANTTRWRGFPS